MIVADDFLNKGWRILWASDSVTVDAAQKLRLNKDGLELIEEYRHSAPTRRAPLSLDKLRNLRV